jgi:diphosphomevalonate decarboxylase
LTTKEQTKHSINQEFPWTQSSAPSNIALIKYMGKIETRSSNYSETNVATVTQHSPRNKPTNSSLSWTLQHLRTFVRIRPNTALENDVWRPFVRNDLLHMELSEVGLEKYLNFFTELKKEFKLKDCFEIESANNFPADAGLASSASSFAALTMAAHDFYTQTTGHSIYTPKELAKISQRGSGSSCRSFFKNWALWHATGAEAINLPFENLQHVVVICDDKKKAVTSSEAHKRVLTSDLFKGRPERAEERLQSLITKMRAKDWKGCFYVCWNEFWDMHTLFHTSNPPFIYMSDQTMKALNSLLKLWQDYGDGPLVTMDAGSHIHLLFRDDQTELKNNVIQAFAPHFKLWTEN